MIWELRRGVGRLSVRVGEWCEVVVGWVGEVVGLFVGSRLRKNMGCLGIVGIELKVIGLV